MEAIPCRRHVEVGSSVIDPGLDRLRVAVAPLVFTYPGMD
jgi:hypothetical protein